MSDHSRRSSAKLPRNKKEYIKGNIEGHNILRWLLELHEYPKLVSGHDPGIHKFTLLERMHQWVQARRRPGISSHLDDRDAGDAAANSARPGTALFMKSQIDKCRIDSKFRNVVTKFVNTDPAIAFSKPTKCTRHKHND